MNNRIQRITVPTLALPLTLVVATLSGCASAGKLAEYDFRDRTVGVVSLGSPRPEILTDAVLDLDFSNPMQAVLRIGADVAKEVEASRARGRLGDAATEVDVPGRMMDRVLQGVAGELRATPVDDARTADFELEVFVKRYGIDAEAWLGPAHFFIESEVILREASTGRRIWKGKVTEREPISPVLLGTPEVGWQQQAIANDVLTAAALASLSPEAMARTLEALADYSADRILRSFRQGLEKSRNGAAPPVGPRQRHDPGLRMMRPLHVALGVGGRRTGFRPGPLDPTTSYQLSLGLRGS